MFTVGAVVEGAIDREVIRELAKKCRQQVKVVCRPCRGSVVGKMRGLLDELDSVVGVDKLLVVCDVDGCEPSDLKATMSKAIANRRYRAEVKFVIATQSLEAWLLADDDALRDVIGPVKRIRSPEALRDPKSELKTYLSRARIDYSPEIARRIAENARPDVLAKRCRSFEEFRQAIVDC